MKNGADLLVDGLVRWGVTHLFGMPGSHSTAIYDAISRARSIRTTLIRNEQAGAFAADGYARVDGTARGRLHDRRTGRDQRLDRHRRVLGRLGSRSLARRPGELRGPRSRVWQLPRDRPRGDLSAGDTVVRDRAPARGYPWLSGPGFSSDDVGTSPTGRPLSSPRPDAGDLHELDRNAGFSSSARTGRTGRGDRTGSGNPGPRRAPDHPGRRRRVWSGAAALIEALARRLGAPVITTLNGKGLLDERHPLSLGHARSSRGRHALAHADAMLAVGCRFTEVMTDWRRMPIPRTLIQIDLDPEQIGMNHPVDVGIVADARAALERLGLGPGPGGAHDGWGELWDEARSARPARPEWLIDTLREIIPGDVPVFTDACEMGYRMQADWPSHGPRRFFYPSNYITLGWAFPAAIGAAVASGGPVLSVSGDGGFVMTAQELATAVRYRLRVIALVHNDSTYGAIKNIQKRAHEGRYLDVELNNPDFLELAAAYGVPGSRAQGPEELRAAVAAALDRDGPSLIEVPDEWRFLRDLATPVR